MSVWFALPSAKPPADAQPFMDAWSDMGYKLAIFRQDGVDPNIRADLILTGPYRGWPTMCNLMAREVLERYPETEWIVTGGDDMLPDPNRRADEIAAECSDHFYRALHPTYGVMQPIGDKWGGNWQENVHKICGSPWMGAEFVRRWNGGAGPLCTEYWHSYADEELYETVKGAGILWQREDLSQKHVHHLRENRPQPAYMRESYNRFQADGAIFRQRKARGFPGWEPISIPASEVNA